MENNSDLIATISEDLRLAHVDIKKLEANIEEYKLTNAQLVEKLKKYGSDVKQGPVMYEEEGGPRAGLFDAWRQQHVGARIAPQPAPPVADRRALDAIDREFQAENERHERRMRGAIEVLARGPDAAGGF